MPIGQSSVMMIPKLKEKEHLILSCHALDLGKKNGCQPFVAKVLLGGNGYIVH